MTGEHAAKFRASLNRCLANPAFLKRFYDLFMASSDEVREKFRNTDFSRQTRVLADSLYLMAVAAQAAAAHGEAESPAWVEMARLAKRHSGADLDVRPEHYDLWLDRLLAAAREHDPQFSPEVETGWRETLAVGIEFLRSRH